MNRTPNRFLTTAVAVGALAFAGCSPQPNDETVTTAPERSGRVDPSVAAADKRADELRADASRAIDKAASTTSTMAAKAGDAVSDATITASVNAALAADDKLSAMKIDVDTQDGVVTLSGPAPDEQSRSRATQLAANARGVVRVENQLAVQKS
jgi:hyperosmotically inducible protein